MKKTKNAAEAATAKHCPTVKGQLDGIRDFDAMEITDIIGRIDSDADDVRIPASVETVGLAGSDGPTTLIISGWDDEKVHKAARVLFAAFNDLRYRRVDDSEAEASHLRYDRAALERLAHRGYDVREWIDSVNIDLDHLEGRVESPEARGGRIFAARNANGRARP